MFDFSPSIKSLTRKFLPALPAISYSQELDENKKGQISKNMSLSRVVESEGIEPSSKQAKKVLSTRLVFN